jgi:SpoIID/LytB domain protein
MSKRARRGLAALIATLIPIGLLAAAPPSSAEGPTEIVLTGHGYGHGRGMGQYGAKGYADAGQSAGQILDHYYGGTTTGSRANSTLKVLLCDIESVPDCTNSPGVNQITVTSTAAFSFEGIANAFPGGTALRITRDAAHGVFLVDQANQPSGCGATNFSPVGAGSTGDTVIDLDPGGALLQLCAPKARSYRGSLKFAVNGTATRVVNFVALEDYLKGVVPSEMPSSWNPEALKVQAVAARSYALSGDTRFPNFADTCDTTLCQVYLGASNDKASTNTAIDQTAGQVRLKGDAVARTEFSSSTGGYTAGGTFPAVVDDGDATPDNPNHNWTTTLSATQIEQAYPAIGDLQSVVVKERNGLGADGGRVTKLQLVGASSNLDLTGEAFRSKFGLRSTWYTPGIKLVRIADADRYATAVAIAKSTFPSATTALLARGDGADSFADGLAANYLGGVQSAPTLLAKADELPAVTLQALKDLGVKTVHLLGGTGALSANVESALQSNGFTVDRISGDDRFATAAAVARAGGSGSIGTIDSQPTAVLSSGRSYPDALAAGGIVYALHYPQLLSEPGSLPAATASALKDLGIKHVILTGGTGALATGVDDAVKALGITTERIAGATRYETAVNLATTTINRLFASSQVDVATGESFPDALTGGSHAGRTRSLVLLTQHSAVPSTTCSFLQARGASITSGHIFGGTGAVDDNTKAGLESCL